MSVANWLFAVAHVLLTLCIVASLWNTGKSRRATVVILQMWCALFAGAVALQVPILQLINPPSTEQRYKVLFFVSYIDNPDPKIPIKTIAMPAEPPINSAFSPYSLKFWSYAMVNHIRVEGSMAQKLRLFSDVPGNCVEYAVWRELENRFANHWYVNTPDFSSISPQVAAGGVYSEAIDQALSSSTITRLMVMGKFHHNPMMRFSSGLRLPPDTDVEASMQGSNRTIAFHNSYLDVEIEISRRAALGVKGKIFGAVDSRNMTTHAYIFDVRKKSRFSRAKIGSLERVQYRHWDAEIDKALQSLDWNYLVPRLQEAAILWNF